MRKKNWDFTAISTSCDDELNKSKTKNNPAFVRLTFPHDYCSQLSTFSTKFDEHFNFLKLFMTELKKNVFKNTCIASVTFRSKNSHFLSDQIVILYISKSPPLTPAKDLNCIRYRNALSLSLSQFLFTVCPRINIFLL